MAKSASIGTKLPALPEGFRWSVTVLDSSVNRLGLRLCRVKPFRDMGTAVIMESWTPAVIRNAVADVMAGLPAAAEEVEVEGALF